MQGLRHSFSIRLIIIYYYFYQSLEEWLEQHWWVFVLHIIFIISRMSNIRRWARTYYNISPIIKDALFQKAGNEALVAINPRLFAAYCIKMARQKIYNKEKVSRVVQEYFNQQNYWTQYTLKLLSPNEPTIDISQSVDKEDKNAIKQRFGALTSKLFQQQTTQKEFKVLCQYFEVLLGKGLINELDYYVLDLSFSSIDQIAQISSINQEAALQAISHNSLQLIESQAKTQVNPDIFQLISLLNRIKETATFSPQLASLYSMFEGNKIMGELYQDAKKQSALCVRKQALGYMLWLLNVNQLGQFISKFVRQDYLFRRYCENSVQVTCSILQMIDVTPSLKLSQLLLLNEIIYKLQDMQDQKKFFEHVKRNLQIEIRLKKLKEKLHESLSRYEQGKIENDQWIREVDRYQIDFKSSQSIAIMKKLINRLLANQHFSIILSNESYAKLLKLCIKMNEIDLYDKIRSRIGKNKKINFARKNGFLLLLQSIYGNEEINKQISLQIYSIYELKRIKAFSLGKNIDKYNQYLSSNDQELLKLLFIKINKGQKQLYEHQIDHTFDKVFESFKL